MRGNICLDTNIIIGLLNNSAGILKTVESYSTHLVPLHVLGELRFGAYRSSKKSENLVKIDALEMRCTILEPDSETADIYGQIRSDLAKAGTPIPENDVWIAAACIQIKTPLLTNDKHFKNISALHTIFC